MKRLSMILITLLIAATLAGCAADPNVPFEDLVSAIKGQVIADLKATGNFEDAAFADGQVPSYMQFNLLEDEDAEYVLEIDKSLLAEGYALPAAFNINADKIIVLKAKDKDSVADVKAALEAELEKQEQTWGQYLPDQYEKVKNNVIKVQGTYLLYATYGAPEGIVTAFDEALK